MLGDRQDGAREMQGSLSRHTPWVRRKFPVPRDAVTPKTLRALLNGLEGCEVRGDLDAPVTGVAYHSREVVPGGRLRGPERPPHRRPPLSRRQPGAGAPGSVVTEQELTAASGSHGGPGAPGPPGPGPPQRRLLRPPQPGADPGGHYRHQRQDQHHLSPGGHPQRRRRTGWGWWAPSITGWATPPGRPR